MMSQKAFYIFIISAFAINAFVYFCAKLISKNYKPIFKLVVSGLLIAISTKIIYSFVLANLYSSGQPLTISEQYIGILSCLTLFFGGVILTFRPGVSAIMLLCSTMLYLLSALVPLWPEYGLSSFDMLIDAFYVSMGLRVLFAFTVIYIYYQERAANKSLKAAP